MPCNTIEEAYLNQDRLWKLKESGELKMHGEKLREQSMHPDYEMRPAYHLGIGNFSTNKITGEAHECKAEWNKAGTVLLCTTCFYDGT